MSFKRTIQKWENVTTKRHQFGGIQFDLKNKEICHIHGNGIIDIFWKDKKERDFLIQENYCKPHHVHPKSKWTTFYLNSKNLENALNYTRINYNQISENKSFLNSGNNIDDFII